MRDDEHLREKAREAIDAGKVPGRRPDRMWGGPSAGVQCTVCGEPVQRNEVELELEFSSDDGPGPKRHRVHVRCFAALELELQQFDVTRGNDFVRREDGVEGCFLPG